MNETIEEITASMEKVREGMRELGVTLSPCTAVGKSSFRVILKGGKIEERKSETSVGAPFLPVGACALIEGAECELFFEVIASYDHVRKCPVILIHLGGICKETDGKHFHYAIPIEVETDGP